VHGRSEQVEGRAEPRGEWGRELRDRLATLQLSPSREAEIVDELSQHLDDRYELRADGTSGADARRLAIAELDEAGGLAQRMGVLSQAHVSLPIVPGTRRGGLLRGLWQDLHDAACTMRRHPGFAAAIVATLAFGIAVNTTAFTIVNGVVFRPLPFDHADRIVELNVRNVAKRQEGKLSYLELRDWQASQTTLERIIGTSERRVDISGDDRPAARVAAAFVSSSTFSMLGQPPVLGRDFRDTDEREGAMPVVLIGGSLWNSRYGADPTIIGRTIRVDGVPSTVATSSRSSACRDSSSQRRRLWRVQLVPGTRVSRWPEGEVMRTTIGGLISLALLVGSHARIASMVNARRPGAATHVELTGLDHCWTRHDTMEGSRGNCGKGQAVSTFTDAVVAFLLREAQPSIPN
jgi:hypothetical protein